MWCGDMLRKTCNCKQNNEEYLHIVRTPMYTTELATGIKTRHKSRTDTALFIKASEHAVKRAVTTGSPCKGFLVEFAYDKK
jgi:hypothetical protein